MSDKYRVRDAACPISTREERGRGGDSCVVAVGEESIALWGKVVGKWRASGGFMCGARRDPSHRRPSARLQTLHEGFM